MAERAIALVPISYTFNVRIGAIVLVPISYTFNVRNRAKVRLYIGKDKVDILKIPHDWPTF